MIMGAWGLGRKPKLPYDAEVEYLESTGTQWIDTGWLFQKNIRIVLDVRFTESTKTWLWGRNAANYEVLVGPSTTFYFGNSNGGASFSDNVDYTLDLDFTAGAMVAKVNGTVVKSTTGTQPTGTHIGLFSLWTYSNTTPDRMGSMRHKGITIYQGGKIVRNLKAVRFTNEQGVSEGAMFDRANPTVGMNPDGSPRTDGLYRNRGTGAFLWAEKQ